MRYLVVVIALLQFFFQSQELFASQVHELSLYESLFYNEIPEYSPSRLDISHFPKEVQVRLITYIERAKKFRSKLKQPHGPAENKMGFPKLVQVEKGVVSLIDIAGIEDIAAAYARNAKIYLEWEGMSEGPLEESRYAEEYLKQNSGTPIKPYLLLFLIHRYRIAFECLANEKDDERQAETAAKYHQYMKMARAEKDPLIGAIADDISKQSYLYIDTKKYP